MEAEANVVTAIQAIACYNTGSPPGGVSKAGGEPGQYDRLTWGTHLHSFPVMTAIPHSRQAITAALSLGIPPTHATIEVYLFLAIYFPDDGAP